MTRRGRRGYGGEYNGGMGIIDMVFPVSCVGCKQSGKYICNKCWRGVEGASQVCPRCGESSRDGWRHGRCKVGKLTRMYGSYKYRGVVQKLLKKVKYKSSWKMVDELADKWVQDVSDQILEDVSYAQVVVTSVPMYGGRQRERGFNQAERLGRKLAEKLGLEYVEMLERVRSTKPMYGLSKEGRRENVRGAFKTVGMGENMVSPVHDLVIIVDDVWTTGSTMRECARVLARVGVEEVWGVVVAR